MEYSYGIRNIHLLVKNNVRAYSVTEIVPKKTGNKFYLCSHEEDKSLR